MPPVCIINIVGLTPAHIGEHTPNLAVLARKHGARPMRGVLPAVTCSAQATMLTGKMPAKHGIVGNGWLFRDTMEIRFWQQSRRLIQAPTLYDLARERTNQTAEKTVTAKLFWWFNQGEDVDFSLTPKPWYGCDGNKIFGVHGSPPGFAEDTVKKIGEFPFHTFWGPTAGLECSEWIAAAGESTIDTVRPDISMIYLPHLDYDLQRFGPHGPHLPGLLREVDACAGQVISAAQNLGAEIIIVSEYGLCAVTRPVHINRILRANNLLVVRDGPFGEVLDTFQSRAFAVSDHQMAHIYVRNATDIAQVKSMLTAIDGIDRVLDRNEQCAIHLDHDRSGELVALAAPDTWFTYYYWLENAKAPDFARTVDIHRKPGYDPCELFFAPELAFPRITCAKKLLQKKLGLRYRFDVIPLDAGLVKGSHGLEPQSPEHGPVFVSTSAPPREEPAMTDIRDYILGML